jgi:hypothetical protein
MDSPDGFEASLWAMLTQMGSKHEVPQDQRNIKREEVAQWFEENGIDWVMNEAGVKILECYAKAFPEKPKDVPPDPNLRKLKATVET